MDGQQYDLGRHEQAIQQLLANDEDIMQRLGRIETHLAEVRGEKKVIKAMWTIAGGAVGAIITLTARFFQLSGGRHSEWSAI